MLALGTWIVWFGVQLHYDGIFKLRLMAWKGYTTKYPPPPNRRIFTDNQRTEGFVADPTNLVAVEQDTVCNDYVADRLSSRTRAKVTCGCFASAMLVYAVRQCTQ